MVTPNPSGEFRTITVVVTEDRQCCYQGSPWPMIYTVEMEVLPTDEAEGINAAFDHTDEILRKVAKERAEEAGIDYERAREGLRLEFAFEGDLRPVLDWRT